MDYGLVSIIMPSWNCERYVATTIESVLSQSYVNWELIFQDDCSSDDTRQIVARYAMADPRVRYERNPQKSGAAVTRNNALKRARGRWIAFLDSDDIWEPVKLEHQLEFMIANGYHFSYSGYQEIDADGNAKGVFVSGPKRISRFGMYAYCWAGCLTVMYDRDVIGHIQIPDIDKNNDYAMWLMISQKSDCFFLDECLAKYRRGRVGSVSTHRYSVMIKWHYKLWREAMSKSLVASLFWTGMNLVCGLCKKIKYVHRI